MFVATSGGGERRGACELVNNGANRPRRTVVDDHVATRTGIVRILSAADPTLVVVGEAGSGPEAVGAWRALRPDVVLMDLRMPGGDGVGEGYSAGIWNELPKDNTAFRDKYLKQMAALIDWYRANTKTESVGFFQIRPRSSEGSSSTKQRSGAKSSAPPTLACSRTIRPLPERVQPKQGTAMIPRAITPDRIL
ncbi:response regulator, partial [Lacticaseibacillus rhamnosus]